MQTTTTREILTKIYISKRLKKEFSLVISDRYINLMQFDKWATETFEGETHFVPLMGHFFSPSSNQIYEFELHPEGALKIGKLQ